ncbi:S-layer homology domain-containing protein [Paenibacillus sp. OV219]|uniref:S-layer homology domain-containing protein n=1 Tax=Paenibacillus sp. OV219 TaxID=1884377 RepID=UPI0008BF807E|nr:S-layer homology domain-containing protein [Paenibacillus sp. OV219]SEN63672.1 S-layer homology domain-containing protein [Paenibacillus sp. OV219]
MSKKLCIILMMLALFLQLIPSLGTSKVTAAPAGSFVFPDASYDPLHPRTTSDERINLTGSINGVNPTSITYGVYQITKGDLDPTKETVTNKRENLTSNLYVTGSSLQIYNLQLFPGINRITFTGIQGGSIVSSSIYIDYRNGPLFYNLTASLDGNNFPIKESGTTVVESQYSRGRSSADISITGNAPNSSQVTVIVNDKSRTYAVNSTNNNSFAASPITLQKGKNLVTIKVSNQNQTIETTREIAFYNGDVTFYDVTIGQDTNVSALEKSPKFLKGKDGSVSQVVFTGKVIVPNKRFEENGTIEPHPNPDDPLPITFKLENLDADPAAPDVIGDSVSVVGTLVGVADPTAPFFTYEFALDESALAVLAHPLDFAKYKLTFSAKNEEKTYLSNSDVIEGTSFKFEVIDGSLPYIYQVNYLPGYKPGADYDNIEGVELNGKSLYTMPYAIEFLIGNDNGAIPEVWEITDVNGKPADDLGSGFEWAPLTTTVTTEEKYIDGVLTSFTRLVYEVSKMPFEGTQTMAFSLDGGNSIAAKSTPTLLFGPYVSYTSVYDNMNIEDDTTANDRANTIVLGSLSNLAGHIENISNLSDIVYDNLTPGLAQTIFLYVNNTPITLMQNSEADVNGGTAADFIPADANSGQYSQTVFDALISGENTIRFVYRGKKSSYEKTIKIYLNPTNLPEIPAKNSTVGVFPFSVDSLTPIPDDSAFPLEGSIYTTKKSQMKVFGSFDFLDLGTDVDVAAAAVDLIDIDLRANYILKIESTIDTKGAIYWNLTNKLHIYDSTRPDVAPVDIGVDSEADGKVSVSYDVNTQTFSFLLPAQELLSNGSSSVYNFYVYNSGLAGPRASYRLEVDPTALPYDIIRPLLPTKGIINKNFVEVVIKAPSAESVVINKVTAEKIKYDADNSGGATGGDYDAFRATVEDLKPGVNKISFTIQSKNDKTTDYFNITYSPTNIPGAELMQLMKNSHKVFDNALSLTFPKGTTLTRRDFNVPDKYKNQIYTGHKLLFAIANGEDGVVDRHEFETLPSNFDRILESFGTRFKFSFPSRFTKASPVYWIDAGLADDMSSADKYDPQTTGVDPYQFPGAIGTYGTKIPTYDERPDDRELVTSKIGSLTLSFDPSMRDSVGTIVTVYRYDVKNKYWENLGGVVDNKKNTVTVPFNQFGYYVVAKMVYGFNDVSDHPYARNYMEAMYAKGIMNSAGLDEFGANIYVSRGEFARMLVKALDVPLNYELGKSHFDDVASITNPDALWDYRYVETAAREGIIRGKQPRTFAPSDNLSRQEAAVILARALDSKLDTDATKINKALEKQFKDFGEVDYYARAAVSAIAKKGYIQGSPLDSKDPKKGYAFEPQSSLLRSDAAIILGKVLADLKRLPKLN